MATTQFLNAATANAFTTSLDGNVALGDTSILLTTVTGLQAPGILCLDRTNGTTATPNQREYIGYTGISTRTLTGVLRGLAGSTAQPHNSGALVEENMSIDHWNDLIASLSVEHNTVGTHTAALVTTLKATGAVVTTGTSDVTIVTPKALSDSGVLPLVNGYILANETPTYNAVDKLTVASGAASKYMVGDMIKWTQHAVVKYGEITVVADTLLSILVNTEFTVEDTATYPITLFYYSHQANPVGHSRWFACAAPSFDVGSIDDGSGGQPTISEYRAKVDGHTYSAHFRGTGTKAGTGVTVFWTSPVAIVNSTARTTIGSGNLRSSIDFNYLCVVVALSATQFYFLTDANIADNTALGDVSANISYEI